MGRVKVFRAAPSGAPKKTAERSRTEAKADAVRDRSAFTAERARRANAREWAARIAEMIGDDPNGASPELLGALATAIAVAKGSGTPDPERQSIAVRETERRDTLERVALARKAGDRIRVRSDAITHGALCAVKGSRVRVARLAGNRAARKGRVTAIRRHFICLADAVGKASRAAQRRSVAARQRFAALARRKALLAALTSSGVPRTGTPDRILGAPSAEGFAEGNPRQVLTRLGRVKGDHAAHVAAWRAVESKARATRLAQVESAVANATTLSKSKELDPWRIKLLARKRRLRRSRFQCRVIARR